MYTGIILHQGTVKNVKPADGGGLRLRIDAPEVMDRVHGGSSVNVEGICLTATETDANGFWSDVMPETLAKTNIGGWTPGRTVNIEPSLRVGDEMGGHIVYGHVDGTVEVVDLAMDGNARVAWFRMSPELAKFIVPKGSVALNGASLTVVDVTPESFTVSMIPETVARTTFRDVQIGDRVNVEADMILRYGERR